MTVMFLKDADRKSAIALPQTGTDVSYPYYNQIARRDKKHYGLAMRTMQTSMNKAHGASFILQDRKRLPVRFFAGFSGTVHSHNA